MYDEEATRLKWEATPTTVFYHEDFYHTEVLPYLSDMYSHILDEEYELYQEYKKPIRRVKRCITVTEQDVLDVFMLQS